MKRSQARNALGICSECKDHSAFKLEDQGIGSYEFWGAKGTHHDYRWVSECCEAYPEGEVDVRPDDSKYDDDPRV